MKPTNYHLFDFLDFDPDLSRDESLWKAYKPTSVYEKDGDICINVPIISMPGWVMMGIATTSFFWIISFIHSFIFSLLMVFYSLPILAMFNDAYEKTLYSYINLNM